MTDDWGEDYESNYFGDVSTLPSSKWPKVNDHVIVPYTIPSRAMKRDKAAVARVVMEFEKRTCIRQALLIIDDYKSHRCITSHFQL